MCTSWGRGGEDDFRWMGRVGRRPFPARLPLGRRRRLAMGPTATERLSGAATRRRLGSSSEGGGEVAAATGWSRRRGRRYSEGVEEGEAALHSVAPL
jgi:hypothetical protein